MIYDHLGDKKKAEECTLDSLKCNEKIGNPLGQAICCGILARLYNSLANSSKDEKEKLEKYSKA